MMLSSRDVENCEDTPAIMEEKGETKKRGRTYCVAGAPNDVRYKNNTLTPGISMRYLPKYVPALKASNTYHWSNQRKMTNTFSKKMATLRACSPTGHDCSTICSADISQAKNGERHTVIYFTRLRCTQYSLVLETRF